MMTQLPRSAPGSPSVLLLEDHPLHFLALRDGLVARLGADCVAACSSTQAAFGALEQADFHGLLTDWRLREGNASDVVQRFRAQCPHAVVVVYSAYSEAFSQAIEAGAHHAYDKSQVSAEAVLDQLLLHISQPAV